MWQRPPGHRVMLDVAVGDDLDNPGFSAGGGRSRWSMCGRQILKRSGQSIVLAMPGLSLTAMNSGSLALANKGDAHLDVLALGDIPKIVAAHERLVVQLRLLETERVEIETRECPDDPKQGGFPIGTSKRVTRQARPRGEDDRVTGGSACASQTPSVRRRCHVHWSRRDGL